MKRLSLILLLAACDNGAEPKASPFDGDWILAIKAGQALPAVTHETHRVTVGGTTREWVDTVTTYQGKLQALMLLSPPVVAYEDSVLESSGLGLGYIHNRSRFDLFYSVSERGDTLTMYLYRELGFRHLRFIRKPDGALSRSEMGYYSLDSWTDLQEVWVRQ